MHVESTTECSPTNYPLISYNGGYWFLMDVRFRDVN